MAARLPHDSIKPFETSSQSKKEQVAHMFDSIAGRYDLMNRLFSARIDVKWRKKAIKQLAGATPVKLLDIATGTGDMAILATQLINVSHITGIDISQQMLKVGQEKVKKQGLSHIIDLQYGDSEAINFEDNTFDAGMAAFGVRNFQDLGKGLKEICRVLKPGGKMVILEFSSPRGAMKNLYNLYMGIISPEVARWFGQNKAAYTYLNKSTNAFPEREVMVDILNHAGFTNTRYTALSFGICCIYTGFKPN